MYLQAMLSTGHIRRRFRSKARAGGFPLDLCFEELRARALKKDTASRKFKEAHTALVNTVTQLTGI